MMFDDRIFQPYYIKASKGVNAGFILSVLFCSKIESIERQIIYIFYMCNIIPHEFLKHKSDKLNKEFLLKLIFELTANKKYIPKKDLRQLTGLEDKGTFNKYFSKHLKANNLDSKRAFTLHELFIIFEFWQEDDKWSRMKAFSKKELAKKYTNNNYDELELIMTDNVLDVDFYKNHDYIKPGHEKRLNEVTKSILKSKGVTNSEIFYKKEFNTHYLYFLLAILAIDKLQLLEE